MPSPPRRATRHRAMPLASRSRPPDTALAAAQTHSAVARGPAFCPQSARRRAGRQGRPRRLPVDVEASLPVDDLFDLEELHSASASASFSSASSSASSNSARCCVVCWVSPTLISANSRLTASCASSSSSIAISCSFVARLPRSCRHFLDSPMPPWRHAKRPRHLRRLDPASVQQGFQQCGPERPVKMRLALAPVGTGARELAPLVPRGVQIDP